MRSHFYQQENVARIFWSGGWDSTFRILTLLSETDLAIQPYYVIDPERPSAAIELETIYFLRDQMQRYLGLDSSRLLPMETIAMDAIPEDAEVDCAHQELRKHGYVGLQYAWLARFARWQQLENIELSVERGINIYPHIEGKIERTFHNDGTNYRLATEAYPEATVFGPFLFPLIMRSSREIHAEAADRGWDCVLDRTWFCYRPVAGRYPCGSCRPCVYIMDKNPERYRLPLLGRVRYFAIEKPKRVLPKSGKTLLKRSILPFRRRKRS